MPVFISTTEIKGQTAHERATIAKYTTHGVYILQRQHFEWMCQYYGRGKITFLPAGTKLLIRPEFLHHYFLTQSSVCSHKIQRKLN